MGAELFHADMTKLIAAFRNFAKASKKYQFAGLFCGRIRETSS